MFPRDTVTTFVDDPANGAIILATSTRTLLYGKVTCDSPVGDVEIKTGTNLYIDRETGGDNMVETFSQHVTSNSVIYNETSNRHCHVAITYVTRNRNTTADPILEETNTVNVSNFPTGFNINNFPSLQAVAVNNFPTLQDVKCTIGCESSSTLILASSSIEILTTTAPTFQEWMLVVGVFLAINSIHMWNFLFRRPKTIVKNLNRK